ncbi:MAG: hypothetical protein ACYC65_07155 [Candidatus Limnocylindrales bacterium]
MGARTRTHSLHENGTKRSAPDVGAQFDFEVDVFIAGMERRLSREP